jgi:hypothetical protein
MADLDITLKRKVGAAYDVLYPTTTWTQVESKPTTFTPTSHTHGNIQNNGIITAAPVAIENGDTILIANNNNSQLIERGIAFGTGTTTFLRNDGQWVTPAGGGTVTGTGTANLLTYWTGISSIGSLATTTYPTLTELSYVKGVTSALQTQINGKAATSHTHGNITNAGAIGSAAGLVAVTTTSGVLTTEAKFTNLYTNTTPLTIASGGTQTITFSASANTTGVGTTGNPGTLLRVVWGTNTATELVSYVTVKPFSGSDSYTYISQPLDIISSNDTDVLLYIRANSSAGAYSGTSWIVGGGKFRSPTGTDTNGTMYLRSIDRVNF